MEVPDFHTAREMIEYGHIKGGDQKQYVYPETRTHDRTKTFNEVWYDTVGLGQNLYMRGLSGKKVAILSDNSYYWIVCFYSILTGKYTVIPLDAKLMDDDIIDIMRRSHCDAIYYSDEFAGTIEKLKKADGVVLTEYIKISDFYNLIEEGHADLKAGHNRKKQGRYAQPQKYYDLRRFFGKTYSGSPRNRLPSDEPHVRLGKRTFPC